MEGLSITSENLFQNFKQNLFNALRRTKDVLEVITNEKTLCDDIRKWNGDPEEQWPEEARFIGDDSLMAYLSYKLKGSID